MRLGQQVPAWPEAGNRVRVSVDDGAEVAGVMRGAFLSLHTGRRVVVLVAQGKTTVPIYTERIRAIEIVE